MPAKQLKHPSGEILKAFALGQLRDSDSLEVERHVAECDECCQVLGSVADDPLVEIARAAADTSHLGETHFTPGKSVDSPARSDSGARVEPTIPNDLVDHPKYEVLELIGQGGMGAVFKARHRIMDRLVAIKIIHPRLIDNPTAVERFLREARSVASLRHPNIVTALDAERVGETHLLVMDYVEGRPLDEVILNEGRLSIVQACETALQIASGLEHAWQHSMVHRDIKPQNVMIAADGTAKILDLGLARFASEQHDGDGGLTRLTGEHVILGSPDYIAPEQIDDAKNADIRADIYSLGGTLYAMLCGHAPFPTGSTMDKFACHKIKQPDPVEEKRDDVPQNLRRLLERMLAKVADERPQTPAEVIAELEAVLRQTTTALPVVETSPPLVQDLAGSPEKKRNSLSGGKKSAANNFFAGSPMGKLVAIGGGIVVILLLCLMFSGVFNNPNVPGTVSGQQKVLLVIPNRDFWNPDFMPVHQTLVASGVKVDIGSSELGVCTPLPEGGGSSVQANVTVATAKAADYDAVVFMGWKIDAFRLAGKNASEVSTLISEMQAEDKWVTSLCAGNVVLAEHGVLQGKEAATGPHIQRAGALPYQANWTTENPVVVAGKVITGRDDKNAKLFAETLVRELND